MCTQYNARFQITRPRVGSSHNAGDKVARERQIANAYQLIGLAGCASLLPLAKLLAHSTLVARRQMVERLIFLNNNSS